MQFSSKQQAINKFTMKLFLKNYMIISIDMGEKIHHSDILAY